uniref:Crystallin, gamma M2f n=1 Tax=Cyprinus carpio TaxID=7962 RepID=A0A8C2H090_CYPCA
MTTAGMSMCRAIFYEDRNFQGRSYECMGDCADMSPYLSRCHSCKVESGCFMMYDRPNYMGNQYFFRRGDYADYMSMFGMSDCIRSCRMIPMHKGSFRMRIYERENFMGQMYEMMDDCDNIMDRYHMSHCQSYKSLTTSVNFLPINFQFNLHSMWDRPFIFLFFFFFR